MAELDLSADDRHAVRQIVDTVLPGATWWVFGSRATGRARPHSDLDLLVEAPHPLTLPQRAALEDAFEASTLPFLVDIVEASALTGVTAERVAAERLPLPPASHF